MYSQLAIGIYLGSISASESYSAAYLYGMPSAFGAVCLTVGQPVLLRHIRVTNA